MHWQHLFRWLVLHSVKNSFVKLVTLHSDCGHLSINRFLLYLIFIMYNSQCMKCQKMYSTCRNGWIRLGLHRALQFALPAMPDWRVKICLLSNIIRLFLPRKSHLRSVSCSWLKRSKQHLNLTNTSWYCNSYQHLKHRCESYRVRGWNMRLVLSVFLGSVDLFALSLASLVSD